jgi:peptidoglycan/LPS O-acetylase OafA/YrhL
MNKEPVQPAPFPLPSSLPAQALRDNAFMVKDYLRQYPPAIATTTVVNPLMFMAFGNDIAKIFGPLDSLMTSFTLVHPSSTIPMNISKFFCCEFVHCMMELTMGGPNGKIRDDLTSYLIGSFIIGSLALLHEQTRERSLDKDKIVLVLVAVETAAFATVAITIHGSDPYWIGYSTQLMLLGACLLDRAAVLWADRSIEQARKEIKEAGVERPTSTPAHSVATDASADRNQWIQY